MLSYLKIKETFTTFATTFKHCHYFWLIYGWYYIKIIVFLLSIFTAHCKIGQSDLTWYQKGHWLPQNTSSKVD